MPNEFSAIRSSIKSLGDLASIALEKKEVPGIPGSEVSAEWVHGYVAGIVQAQKTLSSKLEDLRDAN